MSLELGKESTHTWHTWHRLGYQMPSVPTQQLTEAHGQGWGWTQRILRQKECPKQFRALSLLHF